jgi:hypothetical protein
LARWAHIRQLADIGSNPFSATQFEESQVRLSFLILLFYYRVSYPLSAMKREKQLKSAKGREFIKNLIFSLLVGLISASRRTLGGNLKI